jgi:hypothetical protein
MCQLSAKLPAKSRQCKCTFTLAKFLGKNSQDFTTQLMDHLHWQTLCDNARDNAGDSDTYCTCLGHLGHSDIKRNNPICVAMPKVAKASKQGLSLSPALLR